MNDLLGVLWELTIYVYCIVFNILLIIIVEGFVKDYTPPLSILYLLS